MSRTYMHFKLSIMILVTQIIINRLSYAYIAIVDIIIIILATLHAHYS